MQQKNNRDGAKKRLNLSKRGGIGGDLFLKDTLVLRDERSAVVYGCKRILLYEKDRICLSLGNKQITLLGEDLICTAFTAGSVTVEGVIHGTAYCTDQCLGKCRKGGEGEKK
ncbi:MAG: YabP/YqfC family sporulation protein [Clostridia bacterium]|nr:YabP/YqfC family sporulation protein [Clostridia bacterium]